MTIARLRVVAAGPLTTLQDAGRPGWRRFGVPPSGAIDRVAFAAGGAALGNAPEAAGIELSLGGITLACEEGAVAIALTGAAAGEIDDVAIGTWATVILAAGTRLRVTTRAGNWGYISFAGAIAAPTWLGSRSTHLLAGLGGGRLEAGATLTIERARAALATGPIAPPDADPITSARIVLGPQERFFAPDTIARLTRERFAATARFDRMGMVLDGPTLPPLRIDMPSEPATRGALQVDGDERVTLLTADHQTTGGYPRIAVVIDRDVDTLAQLPPGAPIRFAAITPEESIAAARAARAARERYLIALRAKVRDRPSLLAANLIGGVVDALASVGDAEIDQQQDEEGRGDDREGQHPERAP